MSKKPSALTTNPNRMAGTARRTVRERRDAAVPTIYVQWENMGSGQFGGASLLASRVYKTTPAWPTNKPELQR